MAMCNIPSTNDDPQYRYKMPRIVTKKEGRGNGSKTCIVNMCDVARALKRPPQYTTKWFGSELGAQSTYTNKEGEGERAIVNGHHDNPIFQTMLDKFIDKYVLCANCHLPEIDMNIKKGVICAKCKACGWAGDLDNNHKLAPFILKNPPSEGGWGIVNLAGAEGGGDKKSKEERRKEKDEKRKAQAEKGGDGEDDEDEDAEPKEKKEKKEKKERSGEKKEKKEKKVKKEGDDDDEDGAPKEKKEKKDKKDKKEKKEKSGEKKEKKERSSKKQAASDDDAEKSDESEKEDADVGYTGEIVLETIRVMRDFIASKGGKASPADFFEELRMQQLAKLFDHKIRLYIALEALFKDGSMGKATLEADDKATCKVIDKVLAAVSIPAKDILWCFNAYISVNEKSVKSFPMTLKVVYDEEWASEEEILKYYNGTEAAGQPGFDEAKKVAAPFLKWLEEAEESGDDDDEEDSD